MACDLSKMNQIMNIHPIFNKVLLPSKDLPLFHVICNTNYEHLALRYKLSLSVVVFFMTTIEEIP